MKKTNKVGRPRKVKVAKPLTKRQIATKQAYDYILNAIDASGYDVPEPKTDQEKLQFLADTFVSEYGHQVKYYGSHQNTLANWFAGLPSACNIEFRNHEIIRLAILWNSIPHNASEKQKDKIINNWFNYIAAKTIQLMGKYDITINKI